MLDERLRYALNYYQVQMMIKILYVMAILSRAGGGTSPMKPGNRLAV